jgi:Ser/Thr protein kinase RdoA (MazF antagonist)
VGTRLGHSKLVQQPTSAIRQSISDDCFLMVISPKDPVGMNDDMVSSHDGAEARALLEKLRRYLERHYGIHILGLSRLERGVYRVDRQEGKSWVARVFPAERPVELVRGDAEVLRFLEEHGFPAERCACADPVSAPGGRGILVTEYIDGTAAEPSQSTLRALGELLGRLDTLPSGSGGVAREAGSLHHYSVRGGGPSVERNIAVSWLDEVDGMVPAQSRTLFQSLREQVLRDDDYSGLPESLIHPDPVLKNAITTPDSGLVLIDWTGAGRGPRLASLAVLLWSGALKEGGWSPEGVDAMVAGYRSHVQLQEKELVRLADVMRIRPLIFACWRYRRAVASGKPPNGTEWWWPDNKLVEAIAARARAAFEDTR